MPHLSWSYSATGAQTQLRSTYHEVILPQAHKHSYAPLDMKLYWVAHKHSYAPLIIKLYWVAHKHSYAPLIMKLYWVAHKHSYAPLIIK